MCKMWPQEKGHQQFCVCTIMAKTIYVEVKFALRKTAIFSSHIMWEKYWLFNVTDRQTNNAINIWGYADFFFQLNMLPP